MRCECRAPSIATDEPRCTKCRYMDGIAAAAEAMLRSVGDCGHPVIHDDEGNEYHILGAIILPEPAMHTNN